MPLRQIKDDGEIELIKKASAASMLAQRVMMQWWVKPGMTERAIAGAMTAVWMENGCERPSYAPIVGSGINSTILHYSANDRTMQDGDILLVDAACEYSMYAADITRTVPVNGHFTPRQREIYNIVLGAQQAAIDAFVAGKSTINDRDRQDPNSLDTVAYNYINTHGKDLHGQPLGQYWLHGLGHMVGIDVHDPAIYPVVLKPGMVFTIEPGIYIPEEKLGVRIECDFLVARDGKLIDLDAALPHTADEIEAAMQAKMQVKMDPRDDLASEQFDALNRAFSEQLLACLDECARGRQRLVLRVRSTKKDKAGLRRRVCASWLSRCRMFSRNRSNATRSAMSFSICARSMARAIPANANWRARFLSASSAAKWARLRKSKGSRGETARPIPPR